MNRLMHPIAFRLTIAVGAVAGAIAPWAGQSHGQYDDAIEVEEITPYTGDPIFLDEPEPQPPAKFVEKEVFTENYEDGKVRVERELARYSDDRREAEGFYREYYPNGQKFVEGQFHDGARTGQWTYWHENGAKNRTVTYTDGQLDGGWEAYRADGTLAAKRGFNDGKRDGTWITYDETGKQPLLEEHYVDGKADGVWKIWFPSGQLQRQLAFKLGQRDGEAVEWDEEGNKRAELTYVDGKPHGTVNFWAADGRKYSQEYDHGKLVSQTVK